MPEVTTDTERFLSALFAPYAAYASARIELRAWKPAWSEERDRYPVRSWWAMQPEQIAAGARAALALGQERDVYMGVLPRIAGKGAADSLRLCGWLWCDVDGGDEGPTGAAELLASAVAVRELPKPHLIVLSGGGLHAYWRLAIPALCRTQEEQGRIRRVLRRLVLAIGGTAPGAHADIASAEPVRVLRVPGTWNWKRPHQARAVKLVRYAPEADAFPLVWWAAHLPAEPLPPRPISRPRDPYRRDGYAGESAPLPPRTLQKVESGAVAGQRHFAMRDVAISARKNGKDEQQIRALVEQCARASGLDPQSHHETRHIDGLVRLAMSVDPDYSQRGYA